MLLDLKSIDWRYTTHNNKHIAKREITTVYQRIADIDIAALPWSAVYWLNMPPFTSSTTRHLCQDSSDDLSSRHASGGNAA